MIIAPSAVYPPVAVIQGWQGSDTDFNNESIMFTLPIDGKPYTAVFDTGAFALTVPQSVGDALKLQPLWPITIGGIDGKQESAYWSSVSINLGGHTFKDVWCVVGGTNAILFGIQFFRDNHLNFSVNTDTNEIDIFQNPFVVPGQFDSRFSWWTQFHA